MKGRRAFFSGAAKFAAMGGAAVVLPREALSEISKSSQLRDVTEEIYIEESYELSPEQVMALMNRVKELERAIANPAWFQGRDGRHGRDGEQGYPGAPGCTGMQGVQGVPGRDGAGISEAQIQQMIFQSTPSPEVFLCDYGEYQDLTINGTVVRLKDYRPTLNTQYDLQGNLLYDQLQWDGQPAVQVPSQERVDRLADCVDYLMRREIDGQSKT